MESPQTYFLLLHISAIMNVGDGSWLSPRKVEYLKFLNARGGRVRTTDIGREFAVDSSTITKTISDQCACAPFPVMEGMGRYNP